MIYLINTEFIFIIIFNWESPDNNGDGWTVCLTFPQFSLSLNERSAIMGSTLGLFSFPLPFVLSLVMLLTFHPLCAVQTEATGAESVIALSA